MHSAVQHAPAQNLQPCNALSKQLVILHVVSHVDGGLYPTYMIAPAVPGLIDSYDTSIRACTYSSTAVHQYNRMAVKLSSNKGQGASQVTARRLIPQEYKNHRQPSGRVNILVLAGGW